MQVTQVRSSSKKSSRCQRDSPDIKQKSSTFLLASKIGDLTQRNQTTCSKELDNRRQKNQADNTEYIRNLYKKYLGKQNNNNSDRKIKTDMKDLKPQKCMITQNLRQKLSYNQEPELLKIHSQAERPSNHTNLFRKMSNYQQIRPSIGGKDFQYAKLNTNWDFYNKILDNQIINLIGNQRSSLVVAMQTINGIRKKHR